ncbi:hypothetical protein Hanom_Chr13g01196111 [Helianthus anomalus]
MQVIVTYILKYFYVLLKTHFITLLLLFLFFFERQIWITDGPLEYHRVTSRTTRSYLSPLGIMPIHQFRRKPSKYGKNPLFVRIELRICWSKVLSHPQDTTRL